MKNLIALITIITLAGCSASGSSDDSCGSINNYTEAQTFPNGLTLQPSTDMYITANEVSDIYEETKACMSAHIDISAVNGFGPNVVFRDAGGWGTYDPTGAYYCNDTGICDLTDVVTINNDLTVAAVPRTCTSDRKVVRHELVHYIINATGNPSGHTELFKKCSDFINTKDGQVI